MVDAITESLNNMFESNIFEAYLSLSNNKESAGFDLNFFINENEGRTKENWFVLDDSSKTCHKNKRNAIPIISFLGYENDNSLFLWEKFIQRILDSEIDISSLIQDAFYRP